MPPFAPNEPKEDLRIVRLIKADHSAVVKFMQKDFRRFEPLMGSQDMNEAESEQFFQKVTDYTLEYPISFAMKKEDGEIVGICLNTYLTRPKPGEEEESCVLDNAKANNLVEIVDELRANIWDNVPASVQKVVDVSILSVDSAYARRGIASALINELDERKLKADGVDGLVSELTNTKSQQLLMDKYGYKSIFEIEYGQWEGSEGKQIFDCSKFNTNSVVLAFKLL